MQNIEFAPGN